MTTAPPRTISLFQWTPQPQAEAFFLRQVNAFLERNEYANALARRMHSETGTRFQDWIDYLAVPITDGIRAELETAGFQEIDHNGESWFEHPGGMFSRIVLRQTGWACAIRVDSVVDFLAAQGLSRPIEGALFNPVRQVCVSNTGEAALWAVERHGSLALAVSDVRPTLRLLSQQHLEKFRTRQRNFAANEDGFAHAESLIDAAIADLGKDWACDLFFQAEREYWQRRNLAARVQKGRQDRLGLGWANHDHHTYRSSRDSFVSLIRVFEKLGFHCRECFTPGREAGWGAQVLEQPVARVVIFADVDMSPDELLGDFAHVPMPARQSLGTVGLWCALHGEAFLQAGMHHLECQFDFDALREQLSEFGVKTMKAFTDLGYLRQAFTEGERWQVEPARIDLLMKSGRISTAEAERFLQEGAIGSHLENLERNQGFKGFNQTGITEIIEGTDPRRQAAISKR